MLENTDVAIKNEQSRETGKKTKKKNKNTIQYVLDTTIRKQTTNNVNKTCTPYKQLEVKMNRTSF